MKTNVFNLIILDESGSMHSIANLALTGINETLQTIRMAQEDHPDQQQYVSLLPFNSRRVALVRDCVPISEVCDLSSSEYTPACSTPLYDAIGMGISSLHAHIGHSKAEGIPCTVLVTIITDGLENASREYSHSEITRQIDELKHGGWLFTYIGANQDSYAVGGAMGIGNCLNFRQDAAGTKAMFDRERAARMRHFDHIAHATDKCATPTEAEMALDEISSTISYFC